MLASRRYWPEKSNSTFSVPNVPEGRYFLQLDFPYQTFNSSNAQIDVVDRTLVELTTSTPDLSTLIASRPDRTQPVHNTDVSANVSGLSPWKSGDGVRLVSSDASTLERINPINQAAGATSYTKTFGWSSGLPDAFVVTPATGPALLNGAKRRMN